MNQTEFRTTVVPASVRLAKPVHVEDLADQAHTLSEKISSGQAFLKVVAYPWGVEFDVCDGGRPR